MIFGSWMEFMGSLLLPASSFGLVAFFVHLSFLFLSLLLVSRGERLRWPQLFLSDGVLILRASCTVAKRQWCHSMSVNCSERVFVRLLFDW